MTTGDGTTGDTPASDARTGDTPTADGTASDWTAPGGSEKDRLQVAGERLDEARRAADEVADQQNLSADERRAAGESATALTPGDEGEGLPREGSEIAPG